MIGKKTGKRPRAEKKGGNFPANFLWGAATSAFQIEGAYNEDGKGESLWDFFGNHLKIIKNGATGNIAIDHYHRYRDDVKIMKDLGLKAYRFSIAWTRILPAGTGAVNQKGIDFYQSLINELFAAGIEPIPTLYHWDYPKALADQAGWLNRKSIDWFAEYAEVCFRSFGGRVKTWITLNEPWIDTFAPVYWLQKPTIETMARASQAAHHQMLAHSRALSCFRRLVPNGRIGIALSLIPACRVSDSDADKAAAIRFDQFVNQWFLDAALKGTYPREMLEFYRKKFNAPEILPEDQALMKSNLVDFIGINYYTRKIIQASRAEPILELEEVEKRDETWPHSGEIYPQGLMDLLVRINRDYHQPEIFITENGAGFPDEKLEQGRIKDQRRIDYLKKHLAVVEKALRRGIKVRGYLVWSIFDNLEWVFGFEPRFGIIYVDFQTLKRTWKQSAFWYQNLIRTNKLPG